MRGLGVKKHGDCPYLFEIDEVNLKQHGTVHLLT
jgi:hypothetical protein